jgi:ATP-dependent Clp protease adaptor protein ClpS
MKLVNPTEKLDFDSLEQSLKKWSIVLYNDEVNSFDDVVSLLMLYCHHEYLQALQCANIAHLKGKYTVKSGEREEVVTIANLLSENGLTVEVE